MQRVPFLSITGLVGAALAIFSCNSVLDIEDARLDPNYTSGECQRSNLQPSVSCMNTSCETCLSEKCDLTAVRNCLRDGSCRQALMEHRSCVGDDCSDAAGNCVDCLKGSSSADAHTIATCLQDKCRSECQAGPATLCDVYCACMSSATNCGGDVTACQTACAAMPASQVHCRWAHCEYATGPSDLHCKHARGDAGSDVCAQAHDDTACAPPQRWATYPCKTNSDCCSNLCVIKDGVGACGN